MIPVQHLPTACNDSLLSGRRVSIGRHSGLRGYREFPWHLHKHTLTHTFGSDSQSLWSSYSVPGPMKCVCVCDSKHRTCSTSGLYRKTQILPALKDWPEHLKSFIVLQKVKWVSETEILGKRRYWEPGVLQPYSFLMTSFLRLSPKWLEIILNRYIDWASFGWTRLPTNFPF